MTQRDAPLIGALAAVCLLLLAASAITGTAPLPIGETLSALFGRGADTTQIIVWDIRLPRAIAAMLVGAALGLSGAALQGLLQNPLAGPGVLGVSAFAALGAVVAIFYGLSSLTAWAIPASAIIFAGVAVMALMFAAGRGASTVTLLLVGIGLSSFAGALTALALNMAPNPYALSDLINWMLGSVANRSWLDIYMGAPFWILGAVLVLIAGRGMRALSLGDETALSLGANPARLRWLIILGASLLTGASVATAGTIGFVGMVAPHLVRPLVGHDPARTLIPSALMAGALLLLADLAVRLAPFDQELKLGVAAALFGAPVFIWIASRLGGVQR